jgi:site-specific recombinase XerC
MLDQAAKPKTINRRLAALTAYALWPEQAGYARNARKTAQGVKAVKETGLAPKWLDKKQRAALLRAVNKEVENAMRLGDGGREAIYQLAPLLYGEY